MFHPRTTAGAGNIHQQKGSLSVDEITGKIKEGPLKRKEGLLFKTFESRYCVLDTHRFYVFKSKTSKNADRVVDVTTSTDVEDTNTKEHNTFRLCNQLFQASDTIDHTSWLECLAHVKAESAAPTAVATATTTAQHVVADVEADKHNDAPQEPIEPTTSSSSHASVAPAPIDSETAAESTEAQSSYDTVSSALGSTAVVMNANEAISLDGVSTLASSETQQPDADDINTNPTPINIQQKDTDTETDSEHPAPAGAGSSPSSGTGAAAEPETTTAATTEDSRVEEARGTAEPESTVEHEQQDLSSQSQADLEQAESRMEAEGGHAPNNALL